VTPKELAEMIYDPNRTDPKVKVTKFSITLDFGDFTRTTKWSEKAGCWDTEDRAKRGKCLAVAQGRKSASPTDS